MSGNGFVLMDPSHQRGSGYGEGHLEFGEDGLEFDGQPTGFEDEYDHEHHFAPGTQDHLHRPSRLAISGMLNPDDEEVGDKSRLAVTGICRPSDSVDSRALPKPRVWKWVFS